MNRTVPSMGQIKTISRQKTPNTAITNRKTRQHRSHQSFNRHLSSRPDYNQPAQRLSQNAKDKTSLNMFVTELISSQI